MKYRSGAKLTTLLTDQHSTGGQHRRRGQCGKLRELQRQGCCRYGYPSDSDILGRSHMKARLWVGRGAASGLRAVIGVHDIVWPVDE